MQNLPQWVKDINEFLFPCLKCERHEFHGIAMEPYGLAFKISFMRNPLASTHKDHFSECLKCDTVKGNVPVADVEKPRRGLMPDLPPLTVPVVKFLFAAPLGQPLHFVEA